MGRKRSKKKSRPLSRARHLARWMDRSVGWWQSSMDGWEKFCTGAVKLTCCVAIVGMLFAPNTTLVPLIKQAPMLASALAT